MIVVPWDKYCNGAARIRWPQKRTNRGGKILSNQFETRRCCTAKSVYSCIYCLAQPTGFTEEPGHKVMCNLGCLFTSNIQFKQTYLPAPKYKCLQFEAIKTIGTYLCNPRYLGCGTRGWLLNRELFQGLKWPENSHQRVCTIPIINATIIPGADDQSATY